MLPFIKIIIGGIDEDCDGTNTTCVEDITISFASPPYSPPATYTLYVASDKNFDQAYTTTGTLTTSNAAAGGTANFTGSDSSWTTHTWSITKNADGYWSSTSAE